MKCECGSSMISMGEGTAYCPACKTQADVPTEQSQSPQPEKTAPEEEILTDDYAGMESSDIPEQSFVAEPTPPIVKEPLSPEALKKRKKMIMLSGAALLLLVIGIIAAYAVGIIGPPRHTATFLLNDGTSARHGGTVAVRGDDLVDEPTAPAREGYAFLYWATSEVGGRRINFPTPLTESLTLFAQWIAEYTVTLNLNDGTDAVLNELVVRDGSTMTTPAEPTRDGYALVHWTTDQAGDHPFSFAAPVTGNLSLYAQWVVERTVTLQLNDGTDAVHGELIARDGEVVATPSSPTRQGYFFDNWTTDRAGRTAYDFSSPVVGDMSLYAQWILQRTITQNLNFSGAQNVPPLQVPDGSRISEIQEPHRQGFNFIRWTSDPAGEYALTAEATITDDMTIYAQWERIPLVFVEAIPPHELHGGAAVADSVVIAGNTYLNNLRFGIRANNRSYGFSLHNLDGQYASLSGYIGRIDGGALGDATITFHGDGERLAAFEISATDLPRQISVDVTGVRLLRIEVRSTNNVNWGASVSFALANALIS